MYLRKKRNIPTFKEIIWKFFRPGFHDHMTIFEMSKMKENTRTLRPFIHKNLDAIVLNALSNWLTHARFANIKNKEKRNQNKTK